MKRVFITHLEERKTSAGWVITSVSPVAQSCLTLCNPLDCSTPGFPVHNQLPELTQTNVHWVGDVIQSSHPLLFLLLLPSIFPSIRIFSNVSSSHQVAKYWCFISSPSSEYSGFISFRIDWFVLFGSLPLYIDRIFRESSCSQSAVTSMTHPTTLEKCIQDLG